MLQLKISAIEYWDEKKEEFVTFDKEQTLQLEHSLVSISKWESKWCKAFLPNGPQTYEETIDYIKCMTITQNVDPKVYERMTVFNINTIMKYIEAPMTATVFNDNSQGIKKEIITSEVIYYWMIAHNIPMECQKWHLHRLLTLIRVCNIKNTPAKKMSKKEIMDRYTTLNAERKKQLNTKG